MRPVARAAWGSLICVDQDAAAPGSLGELLRPERSVRDPSIDGPDGEAVQPRIFVRRQERRLGGLALDAALLRPRAG